MRKYRCVSIRVAANVPQLTEGGELTEYSNLKAEIYE